MVIDKYKLKKILLEALDHLNGAAKIIPICRYVWDNYEKELKNSGNLLYDWQYKIRWAAYELRKEGYIKPVDDSPLGVWELDEEYYN